MLHADASPSIGVFFISRDPYSIRYSNLPILPLLVATCLVIALVSFGLPSIYDKHRNPITSRSVPALLLHTPDVPIYSRIAASNGDNMNLHRKRDMLNPTNQPSTTLIKRHNHIVDTLGLRSRDSSLAKRNLASYLVVQGFHLIGTIGAHADVIPPSALAHDHITESYTNLTEFDGKELASRGYCAIAYGSF